MSVEENKRNSSIELIRIIAMFMIVLSHSVTHGEYETENVFNKIILDWFTLGNIGNHLFILISGYYLCEKVNYKSICKLISQVWCYSLIIFIFCSLFGYQYSFENILEVFFPVVFREYWFITAYIVLVLISPILNIFIKNVSKTSFKAILLVMVCMWIIIPTFTIFQTNLYGDVLPQFMLIYLVGAYFRKYPNNILEIKRIRFLMLVSSVILLYLSTLIIELAGKIIPFAQEKGGIMFAKNSILIVSIAIAIFTSAIYTKPFHNKIINTISSCVFGVYLFHENPAMRELIWKRWLNESLYIGSYSFTLRVLADSLIVFIVGLMIEYIRCKVLGKYCDKIADFIFNKANCLMS